MSPGAPLCALGTHGGLDGCTTFGALQLALGAPGAVLLAVPTNRHSLLWSRAWTLGTATAYATASFALAWYGASAIIS